MKIEKSNTKNFTPSFLIYRFRLFPLLLFISAVCVGVIAISILLNGGGSLNLISTELAMILIVIFLFFLSLEANLDSTRKELRELIIQRTSEPKKTDWQEMTSKKIKSFEISKELNARNQNFEIIISNKNIELMEALYEKILVILN